MSVVPHELHFLGQFGASEDDESVEVEHKDEAQQRADLGAQAWRSSQCLAMTLALWPIFCIDSNGDQVVEHHELPLPHLQMLQLLSVSRQRDLQGGGVE